MNWDSGVGQALDALPPSGEATQTCSSHFAWRALLGFTMRARRALQVHPNGDAGQALDPQPCDKATQMCVGHLAWLALLG